MLLTPWERRPCDPQSVGGFNRVIFGNFMSGNIWYGLPTLQQSLPYIRQRGYLIFQSGAKIKGISWCWEV